jgi:uncharacterized membrane protein YqjE
MSVRDQNKIPLGDVPQGNFHTDDLLRENISEDSNPDNKKANWQQDIEQTIRLGQHFLGVLGGTIDLARVESELAIRTFPKVLMLWLLMMPIILLTWCSFSALIAWCVYAASEQLGAGILAFFILQVILLLACRWLYVKYRKYMTLPYTRAHIDSFIRRAQHEFTGQSSTKE